MSAVLATAAASPARATPSCSDLGYNNAPQLKSHKLYLYFPLTDDPTFEDFGQPPDFETTPAHKFDTTLLANYLGTEAELREAIVDVVTDDYCEFNVEVLATTTPTPTTFSRRSTVAIGTDSSFVGGKAHWGQSKRVDIQDKNPVDFARVWAGTYQDDAGGPGGALEGANSKTDRWANAIGGTVAHEAAHGYGLRHFDGTFHVLTEDAPEHHLMQDGDAYDNKQRAGYRRHFSDYEYSILASNVGLSAQTLMNWSLVNPNQNAAKGLKIDFLSVQSNLTLASVYSGQLSPWVNPTLQPASPATTVVDGVTYFHYELIWSVGQVWSGGDSGEVPGGATFQVGASFNATGTGAPDPIIVRGVTLLDGLRGGLGLNPRVPGFDAARLSTKNGDLEVLVSNAATAPLTIENATLAFLPRLASINSMRPGAGRLLDPFTQPITVWSERRVKLPARALENGARLRLPIANLREGRRIVNIIDAAACQARDSRGALPDTTACNLGMHLSLFPATSTLLTVTVVDPKARQWDRERKKYVKAPLRTTVFYQFAGIHPDLNGNGIDDYIEIATGQGKDHGDWLIYPRRSAR